MTEQPGAYAVVRQQEPQVFVAATAGVLDRVLALQVVAQLPARDVSSPACLEEMRNALLEERWADALTAWIEETGVAVDVYDEPLRMWTDRDVQVQQAAMEMRLAPLFN